MNKPSQFMHDEYPSRSGCAWLFWLGVVFLLLITVKASKTMWDPDTIKDYSDALCVDAKRPTDTALYWVKYTQGGYDGNLFLEVENNSLQDVSLLYELSRRRSGALLIKKMKLTPLQHENPSP